MTNTFSRFDHNSRLTGYGDSLSILFSEFNFTTYIFYLENYPSEVVYRFYSNQIKLNA